jgi:hypothetical protein
LSRNLILAVLALFPQGCRQSGQEVGDIPQPARQSGPQAAGQSAGGTRLSYWGVGAPARDGPTGGAAARLEGVLSRLGGCLVVIPGNGISVQPVFPAGKARWDEASQTLIFAGKAYRPGDRITLGGGGIASPSAYAREPGVAIAPCAQSDLWVVIA